MNRRTFLTSSLAASAALGAGALASAQTPATPAPTTAPKLTDAPASRPPPKPQLDPTLVKEFVGAGHNNLPRVKELLATEPMLINAMWDWGAGDWETAIGGCSHIGNRELALHLLDAGSRFDAFTATMLNETEVVGVMLRTHPAVANTRGPHGYTLLYHAGYTGNVSLAETIAAQITAANRASHFNQTLQSSVGRGHTDFVAYLLDHGVDNPNMKNFQGKTVLDVAIAKKFDAIEKLLRAKGGVTST